MLQEFCFSNKHWYAQNMPTSHEVMVEHFCCAWIMFYSSELLKVSDLFLSLQIALRAVVYRTNLTEPSPALTSRRVQFSVSDGSNITTCSAVISLVLVNDNSPFLDLNGDNTTGTDYSVSLVWC